MKDIKTKRPVVAKVKVRVKSPIADPTCYSTEIELITDQDVSEANFNYWPKLHLNNNDFYITKGEREFQTNPSNRVIYIEEGEAFSNPSLFRVDVDVNHDGNIDTAEFEYNNIQC